MSELDTGTRREVESFVAEWLNEGGAPGASVAVVGADGRRFAEGFGSRDRESNAPATPRTLYGIGSCSKSFAAVAIMQLVEAGDVALEDPLDDYVPHLEAVSGDPVTLADLLSHASGMPSDGSLSALITKLTGRAEGEGDLPMASDADFRRHVEDSVGERLTDRERFFYYNAGFTLLGHVVEEVSGQSFADYVREHVHDPLGMRRSGYTESRFEDAGDRMTAYNLDDGVTSDGSYSFDERLYAPGGMYSSVVEMSDYVRCFLNDGTVDGETLLSPESVATMTERHSVRETYLDGREQGYGFGLQVESFCGDRLVGHGGMMGTTTAYFGYLEEAGVGVVVECNAAPEKHPTVAGKGVLALLAGERPREAVPTYALEAKAEAVVGEYESYRGVRTATVERDGSGVAVEFDDPGWSATHHLRPTSLDPDDLSYEFVEGTGKRVPVEFHRDGDDLSMLFQRWRLHRQ
jgi:CubicO group peptidase (beta-lactamase class C family)